MAVMDRGGAHGTDEVSSISAEGAHSFNLLSLPEDYFERPDRYWTALRRYDPLHRNADGSVLITRYHDIKAVWRDLTAVVDKREFFTRKFGEGPLLEHHTTAMLFRDPPAHDRLRAIVNPFFTQESLRRLTPAIEARVDHLIGLAREQGQIDFVRDFAFQLTIFVTCEILGVPLEDSDLIQKLGQGIIFPLNPDASPEVIADGHAASAKFQAYLMDYVAAARKRPDLDGRTDIISALVASERAGAEISESEILHMAILMMNGGHESTTNLLSVAMKSMVDEPDLLAEFAADDQSVATGIEELIRYASPLQLQGRRLTQATALSEGVLPAGTEVIISVGSANWDDSIFESPNKLNLKRRPNPHVGFGAGVHACIGRPLAKLEATIGLPAFIRAFRVIDRVGPAPFKPSGRFRGISALPLAVS